MANADDTPQTEKPKKGKALKIAIGLIAMVGVGAGGTYGAFAAGLFGGDHDDGPDHPDFVRKGEADPYEVASDGDEVVVVHGDGGSEYRTAYYSFDESFTSNLADSPALIQVDLAVSTQRDGRVLQWVQNHELAIRSAILVQLAATPEVDVYSVEGKEALAKRLTAAVNEVLEQNEGFGGIEAVHFKGILVQ